LLATKPGTQPEGTKDTEDPKTEKKDVDWETIDKLPHNIEVD